MENIISAQPLMLSIWFGTFSIAVSDIMRNKPGGINSFLGSRTESETMIAETIYSDQENKYCERILWFILYLNRLKAAYDRFEKKVFVLNAAIISIAIYALAELLGIPALADF